jgi:hypothetical protein
MKTTRQAFQAILRSQLINSSAFRAHEIDALATILTCVIGSPTFSRNQVAKQSNSKFSRNFLAKCLMKYTYGQCEVMTRLITTISKRITKNMLISVAIDDTLVKKCGKHIHGVYSWFDHSSGRLVTSLCLVNMALIVENELVCVIPWILRKPNSKNQSRGKQIKAQDIKTVSAIEMIQFFRSRLAHEGILDHQIVILADSWYSNRTMVKAIQQTEMNFRLDARSNLSVQCPDHQAISTRGQQRRGRKRHKYVRYVPLKQFLGNWKQWHFFTDPASGERIFYRKVTLTLKTTGRVSVYAFRRESLLTSKFILTRAFRLKSPDPRTVYSQYLSRWRIEEAHRDLKQQFGLTKCQARHAWIVSGFIGIIYLGYSLWKLTQKEMLQMGLPLLKCPSWANEVHRLQIQQEVFAVT